MKRGDVLPDHLEPSIQDGWLVVYVGPLSVNAVDLTSFVVWKWSMHDDGIRVGRGRPTRDPDVDDDVTWIGVPITKWPPPPAIAAYLRR